MYIELVAMQCTACVFLCTNYMRVSRVMWHMMCNVIYMYNVCVCVCRSANRCLLKVAHMSALLQHFEKAAGIFEEVCTSYL